MAHRSAMLHHMYRRSSGPAFVEMPPHMSALHRKSSRLQRTSSVPVNLLDNLRDFVACMVWEKLVSRVHDMNMLAPMGLDTPRAEVMLNTKLSMQFSRQEKLHDPSTVLETMCASCLHDARSTSSELTDRLPDISDVGKVCRCPTCDVAFTRRWAYETGSARFSIGRNPKQFKILPFTEEMEQMVQVWEAEEGYKSKYNSVVLVMYTGSQMCAHCSLAEAHGTISCSSQLGMHRDNGGGGNSQVASTLIRTLNFGHSRTVTMEMCQSLGGGQWQGVVGTSVDYTCVDGSELILDTSDEVKGVRLAPHGPVREAAWYHGMLTPVEKEGISCGLVSRHVGNVCDVRLSDDVVISGSALTEERQASYDRALSHWQSTHGARFSSSVLPVVEAALRAWKQRLGRCRRSSVSV